MERIGKYVIHKSVPTSGYARILLCKDPDLQIPVAVKAFAPQAVEGQALSAPQWLARFLSEARVLAAFDHPQLIGVKTMDKAADGNPYFVMPYMAGSLVAEIGHDHGGDGAEAARRLPLARALAVLKQVSAGLMVLHRNNFVHRAVQPSNILLTARENGQVKLADFSMVKVPDRNPPLPDHWIGGTDYCAPEQREGATTVDARADVYSLGVLTYRLLTGELPAVGDGAAQLPGKHQAVLVDLVARATDPDPALRPAHGGAFLQALGQVPPEALAKPRVQVVPVRRPAAPLKKAVSQ